MQLANMYLPIELLAEHPYLENNSILIGYRGSIAHGMYVPNTDPNSIDDRDAMAIIIPTLDHYFGLREFGSRGTEVILPTENNEWDIVSYEFKKFIKLLINSNPTVLSLLWLPKDKYIKTTYAGEKILEHRDLFISKKVFHSFTGYAHDQMKKMQSSAFKGYMGEKRKALVKKFGFDPKNASHSIRLLRMGIEFLNEGKLFVDRSQIDALELLEIKAGEWPLEQVKKEADKLFMQAEEAYNNSKLPEEINYNKVNSLCTKILSWHCVSSLFKENI
jgi:predicted nucleotidyltransferase